MKTKPLEFEETMKRDVPLVFVEAWYKALTREMHDFFGFDFPDFIFIYANGYVTSYRAPSIFHKEIPLKIAEWLKEEKNEKKLVKLFDSFVESYKKIEEKKKNLRKKCSPTEALKELESCIDIFVHGVQGDIIAYWLPIWNEQEAKRSGQHMYTEKVIKHGQEARKQADPIFDCSADTMYHYIKSIAETNKWDEHVLQVLLFNEIKDSIKNNALPEVKNRKESYIYVGGLVADGNQIGHILKEKDYILKKDNIGEENLVYGIVAYKGKVSGTARIILTRKNFDNLKTGDILITSMTTPMFYPIMAKSAAFVTDEGGMLCHAAIVSRELKIPCIIGTKTATKVFKDGDLVEVDAVNGIVRKI